MTTEWVEWDAFPDPPRRRQKPRIERSQVLPPPPQEPPRLHRVELTIKHHRRAPSHFLPVFAAIVVVLLLWRFKFGVLLAAILGWQTVEMFLFVIALLAIIALNERRHGREF